MAKTVICEWPESDPITYLDHYEVWRKTGSGGTYAKVSGDIAQGTLTYTDSSALADSTQYFYQVRAYNATGGYNEVENNITISASVTYGIKTSGATGNASSVSQSNSPATPTNFEFKLNIHDLIDMDFSAVKWFITNNRASNVNGFWGFQTTTTQNEIVFKIWDDAGGTDGTPFVIAEGDEIKLIKTDEVFTVFVNGGLVDTVQGTGTFLLTAARLILGARQLGSQQTNFSFYNLAFVTETWDFAEQTGITATGSLGTVLDLDIGTGTAGDMWITI